MEHTTTQTQRMQRRKRRRMTNFSFHLSESATPMDPHHHPSPRRKSNDIFLIPSTYFFFWLSLKLVILHNWNYFSLMNIRLVHKKKLEGGPGDDAANETTSDPRDLKLQQLDRDFELALKSGKTSTRRRRKEEEEDIVPFVFHFSPMSISFFSGKIRKRI